MSFLQWLLLLFHFCVFLSQFSELVWKLAEEIILQSASKRFPSFGSLTNGNKSNAKKSRFRPNRNSTRTIYHWSLILRSFIVVSNSAKRDANKGSLTLLASFDFATWSKNQSLVHAQWQNTVPLTSSDKLLRRNCLFISKSFFFVGVCRKTCLKRCR